MDAKAADACWDRTGPMGHKSATLGSFPVDRFEIKQAQHAASWGKAAQTDRDLGEIKRSEPLDVALSGRALTLTVPLAAKLGAMRLPTAMDDDDDDNKVNGDGDLCAARADDKCGSGYCSPEMPRPVFRSAVSCSSGESSASASSVIPWDRFGADDDTTDGSGSSSVSGSGLSFSFGLSPRPQADSLPRAPKQASTGADCWVRDEAPSDADMATAADSGEVNASEGGYADIRPESTRTRQISDSMEDEDDDENVRLPSLWTIGDGQPRWGGRPVQTRADDVSGAPGQISGRALSTSDVDADAMIHRGDQADAETETEQKSRAAGPLVAVQAQMQTMDGTAWQQTGQAQTIAMAIVQRSGHVCTSDENSVCRYVQAPDKHDQIIRLVRYDVRMRIQPEDVWMCEYGCGVDAIHVCTIDVCNSLVQVRDPADGADISSGGGCLYRCRKTGQIFSRCVPCVPDSYGAVRRDDPAALENPDDGSGLMLDRLLSSGAWQRQRYEDSGAARFPTGQTAEPGWSSAHKAPFGRPLHSSGSGAPASGELFGTGYPSAPYLDAPTNFSVSGVGAMQQYCSASTLPGALSRLQGMRDSVSRSMSAPIGPAAGSLYQQRRLERLGIALGHEAHSQPAPRTVGKWTPRGLTSQSRARLPSSASSRARMIGAIPGWINTDPSNVCDINAHQSLTAAMVHGSDSDSDEGSRVMVRGTSLAFRPDPDAQRAYGTGVLTIQDAVLCARNLLYIMFYVIPSSDGVRQTSADVMAEYSGTGQTSGNGSGATGSALAFSTALGPPIDGSDLSDLGVGLAPDALLSHLGPGTHSRRCVTPNMIVGRETVSRQRVSFGRPAAPRGHAAAQIHSHASLPVGHVSCRAAPRGQTAVSSGQDAVSCRAAPRGQTSVGAAPLTLTLNPTPILSRSADDIVLPSSSGSLTRRRATSKTPSPGGPADSDLDRLCAHISGSSTSPTAGVRALGLWPQSSSCPKDQTDDSSGVRLTEQLARPIVIVNADAMIPIWARLTSISHSGREISGRVGVRIGVRVRVRVRGAAPTEVCPLGAARQETARDRGSSSAILGDDDYCDGDGVGIEDPTGDDDDDDDDDVGDINNIKHFSSFVLGIVYMTLTGYTVPVRMAEFITKRILDTAGALGIVVSSGQGSWTNSVSGLTGGGAAADASVTSGQAYGPTSAVEPIARVRRIMANGVVAVVRNRDFARHLMPINKVQRASSPPAKTFGFVNHNTISFGIVSVRRLVAAYLNSIITAFLAELASFSPSPSPPIPRFAFAQADAPFAAVPPPTGSAAEPVRPPLSAEATRFLRAVDRFARALSTDFRLL